MQGWGGCGYHYVIIPDGVTYLGRPESEPGVHCAGFNSLSIGVCVTGNFEVEVPTEAQVASLQRLLADLRKRYLGAIVVMHGDKVATACPGCHLKDIIKEVLK